MKLFGKMFLCAVVALAIAGSADATGIKDYSTTPSENTSPFPDNVLPSQVHSGLRQIQTDIREFFNDSQWVIYGDGSGSFTVAYASATSFTVNSVNVTAVYHTGRRVKAVGSATGTIYGTIASSSFSTNTTVTVTWDSGSLNNEALTISIGILSKDNDSLPSSAVKATTANTFTADQVLSTTGTSSVSPLRLVSTDSSATRAPNITLARDSASPLAGDDLGAISFVGEDTASNADPFARLRAEMVDPTSTSEDGQIVVETTIAGSEGIRFRFGNGLFAESLTDHGAGTVAATDFYEGSTIAVGNINDRTTDTNVDDDDFIPFYDASEGVPNKAAVETISATGLVSCQSASASAALEFGLTTAIANGAHFVEFIGDDLLPTNDGVDFWVRTSTDGGSTYDSGAGAYRYSTEGRSDGNSIVSAQSASDTKIVLSPSTVGNAAGEGISFRLTLMDPDDTDQARLIGNGMMRDTTGVSTHMTFQGSRLASADVDAVQFLMSSSTIASGEICMYAIR